MHIPWWSHHMETYSALLAICAGNSPDPGEFPTQRPVTRSFDVYFDLRLNKRLSKQSWGWWFETPSRQLWCHRNRMRMYNVTITSDCLWKISLCRGVILTRVILLWLGRSCQGALTNKVILTHWARHIGRRFADDISQSIFLNENV